MKTRTPFSSVILYLLGIIFMIVAAFMLWTAIDYTKLYLASYDHTFEEMWSNSVQYIIEKVMPSFAAGIICLGLGKAISVFRKGLAAQASGVFSGAVQTATGKGNEAAAGSVEELALSLKELREVSSIKLEELERREKVRLDDMRETVVRDMALHRLQREAKEEEIISKLNAMGEKMGLDMMDLYAKADIPVVPEMDKEEPEEDKLKDDPLFEELDKAEGAPAEETAEEPAEETEEPEEAIEPAEEVTEEAPEETEEPEEAAETPEEPAEEETEEPEETEEAPEETEEPAEEPEAPRGETPVEVIEKPPVEVEGYGDDQVLTHRDELGVPEQIEETGEEESEAAEEAGDSEAAEEADVEASDAETEEADVEEPAEEAAEAEESEVAEPVEEFAEVLEAEETEAEKAVEEVEEAAEVEEPAEAETEASEEKAEETEPEAAGKGSGKSTKKKQKKRKKKNKK